MSDNFLNFDHYLAGALSNYGYSLIPVHPDHELVNTYGADISSPNFATVEFDTQEQLFDKLKSSAQEFDAVLPNVGGTSYRFFYYTRPRKEGNCYALDFAFIDIRRPLGNY